MLRRTRRAADRRGADTAIPPLPGVQPAAIRAPQKPDFAAWKQKPVGRRGPVRREIPSARDRTTEPRAGSAPSRSFPQRRADGQSHGEFGRAGRENRTKKEEMKTRSK